MEGYYSTLSSWIIPMTRAMQQQGLDIEKALSACDLDLHQLHNQDIRVPIRKLSALIDYCNHHFPAQDFTVQIARYFHPGVFHILGYAMMSADTLEDALRQLVEYHRVVCDISDLRLIETDDLLVLDVSLRTPGEDPQLLLRPQELEVFFAMVVSFARDVIAAEYSPAAVAFQNTALPQGAGYLTDFFRCPVQFEQPRNTLAFDKLSARRQLLTGNATIRQEHEKILHEFLARIDRHDLIHQVKCKILERLSLGAPAQRDVAASLGMSLRNLQRKLSELETSYKSILENSRKHLALHYVQRQDLALGEISYLVGFASESNFHRAFKRWTGQSPGQYRRNLHLSPRAS
ncbi:AraC family transcriptional regulator [Photobacterium galatheae]|uniref:HTH araC/xylS-type domain-containing protein n=1 Tax=Photobacterium galatheae TaxID=1654360 RepID=A0A066RNK2_9GAMM|nr:AraC family transcriptional regulator [Photobacterium galatheae]KDM92040.1 hypothetical protein EA58_08480 [Photobacterium galatheae]MCM0151046.1 AraC family transcriptional regulator [Photobacterium galatheae]